MTADPEAIRQAIAHIISTPSDVSMFSRLPEADQKAILRQANDQEFERYIGHAHQKLRVPMRQERAKEAPSPVPSSAPAAVAPSPRPAAPPSSPRPTSSPSPAQAWPPAQPPTFNDLRLR